MTHSGANAREQGPSPHIDKAGTEASNGKSKYVLAIGSLRVAIPSIAVAREINRLAGSPAKNVVQEPVPSQLISGSDRKYISRHLCWLLNIEGKDSYLLFSRVPGETEMLLAAYSQGGGEGGGRVLVNGLLGPVPTDESSGGFKLPTVVFDEVSPLSMVKMLEQHSASRGGSEIPFEEWAFEQIARQGAGLGRIKNRLKTVLPKASREEGQASSGALARTLERSGSGLQDELLRLISNSGSTDAERALNFVAARYFKLYQLLAARLLMGSRLTSVRVFTPQVSGERKYKEVVFTFSPTAASYDEVAVRVDVTEQFPFVARGLLPFMQTYPDVVDFAKDSRNDARAGKRGSNVRSPSAKGSQA
jgi:PatG C-terminal/PatG Domain